MTKLLNLPRWLLVTTLATASTFACGDDDDDDDTNAGGGSSAGRGGSSAGRGGSSAGRGGSTTGGNNLGGNDMGNAGNGGDGSSQGGADNGTAGEGGVSGVGGAGGAGGMAGAGGEGGAATAALQDAQILLVLDTLNQGEVEEAYAALPRLSVPAVQAFAQQMIVDHSTARQSVASAASTLMLNPTPSDVQLDLRQEAEANVAMLRGTPAANLDQTYMEMQLAAHAEALALLDDLEAEADAAALRTLIATLEVAVQAHYDQAVTIEAGL